MSIKNLKIIRFGSLPLVFIFVFFFLASSARAGTIIHAPVYLGLNNGLIGYWTFDGPNIFGTSARDTSGSGNHGTIIGATKSAGKIGQALNFDGSGDYVDSANFGDNLPNFTASVWFKSTNANESKMLLSKLGVGGLNGTGWAISSTITSSPLVSGGIIAVIQTDSSNWVSRCSTIALNDGAWHQAVMVVSGGSTVVLYVDGSTLNTTDFNSGTIGSYSNSSNVRVGTDYDSDDYNGTMDDVHIYNRALSANEVKRLYRIGLGSTTNKSQTNTSMDKGLVGYWTFDGGDIFGTSARDKSGNGNHGTMTNGPVQVAGTVGQALSFDDVDDVINAGSGASLDNIPATGLTVSAWIYPKSVGENNFGVIAGKFTDVPPDDSGWAFQMESNGTLGLRFEADFGTNNIFRSTSFGAANTVTLNKWQFVTATWTGGSAQTTIHEYVNGNEEANYGTGVDGTGGRVDDGSSNFLIGNTSTGDRTFDGYIDEVRVYNRVLSVDEIKRLYNETQGKFNSSQTASPTNGLVGYWTFDGADIFGTSARDKSGNGNHGTMTGTAKIQGKIGQGLLFNGVYTGDASSDSVSTAVEVGGLDSKTFTGWFKWNSLGDISSSWQWMVGELTSFDSAKYSGLTTGATAHIVLIQGIAGGTDNLSIGWDPDPPSLNTWYFVAGVIDKPNNNMNLYINGQSVNNYTNAAVGAATFYNPTGGVKIGGDSLNTYVFNGTIDDVRVYNRALSAGEIRKLYNMGH